MELGDWSHCVSGAHWWGLDEVVLGEHLLVRPFLIVAKAGHVLCSRRYQVSGIHYLRHLLEIMDA